MKSELLEIRDRLVLGEGLRVELRGSGNGAFVYICSAERAAEVSVCHEGIFVEFWDEASDESDNPPIKSEIVHSISEVMKSLGEWF